MAQLEKEESQVSDITFYPEGRTFVLRIDMDKHPFLERLWKARELCVMWNRPKMQATSHAEIARYVARILLKAAPYPRPDPKPMPPFPGMPDEPQIH
jgi:hypothetical protein